MRSAIAFGLRCAPPSGSGITSSISPLRRLSAAVSESALAAWLLVRSFASLKRMAAQPSGLITLYQLFCSIATRSPTAMPSAPPEPPSPITMQMTGTRRRLISRRLTAMLSACPRCSAPMPGYAPGVSTKVTIGSRNFSASFILRSALR